MGRGAGPSHSPRQRLGVRLGGMVLPGHDSAPPSEPAPAIVYARLHGFNFAPVRVSRKKKISTLIQQQNVEYLFCDTVFFHAHRSRMALEIFNSISATASRRIQTPDDQ